MQKAAVTTGIKRVEILDTDKPVAGPDDAVLRIERVGLCGTDLHVFDGDYSAALPLVQGHEISGVVEQLPTGHGPGLAIGDRVAVEPVTSCGTCAACRRGRRNTCSDMVAIGIHRPGGLQERAVVPLANCHPVGDLPAEITALAETLSVSLRAVTRPQVSATDDVLVLGAGPIGLGTVIAARDLGARVMVLDLHEQRRALARELGAEVTVADLGELAAAVDAWTDGEGVSVVVEATGVAAVAEYAFDVVAHAGRISLVGVSEQMMRIGLRPFTKKELDVYGSRATLDFPAAIALADRHRDEVAKLISHRFPLARAAEALMFTHDHPDRVIKTLIEVGS